MTSDNAGSRTQEVDYGNPFSACEFQPRAFYNLLSWTFEILIAGFNSVHMRTKRPISVFK